MAIKSVITAAFEVNVPDNGMYSFLRTPEGLSISVSVHCPKCRECTCHNARELLIPWEIVLDWHKEQITMDTLMNARLNEREEREEAPIYE